MGIHDISNLVWVSDCCLAPTTTEQGEPNYNPWYRNSPPEPITVCSECLKKCDEYGFTKEEHINALKKYRKDPEDYGYEPEEIEAATGGCPKGVSETEKEKQAG